MQVSRVKFKIIQASFNLTGILVYIILKHYSKMSFYSGDRWSKNPKKYFQSNYFLQLPKIEKELVFV